MVWLRFPFIFTISSLAVALSWNLSEVPGGHSGLAVYDGADDWFFYQWEVAVYEHYGHYGDADADVVSQIAKDLGLVVTASDPTMASYKLSIIPTRPGQRTTAPSAHTLALTKDRRVKWAEPNIHSNVRWRVCVDGGYSTAMQVARDLGLVVQNRIGGTLDTYTFILMDRQNKFITPSWYTVSLSRDRRVKWFAPTLSVFHQLGMRHFPRYSVYTHIFNDGYWHYQWYMHYRSKWLVKPWTEDTDKKLRMDMNVLSAYAMGYNGRGVRISVLDDGIEHTHTDLRDNYDPEISWDFIDNDPDPTPDYTRVDNRGTRIAGQIAMTANNYKCGVGVAWGAKVGGVRMRSDTVLQSDSFLAKSISYACDKVDIYVIAWGPADDGRTVYELQSLSTEALERCISEGRGGKGAIYVHATGNGGFEDDCNCDGLSSNIYTISIGSVNWVGDIPPYGEQCESTLAVAYSSDFTFHITTTDLHNECMLDKINKDSSAAAPLAAGIIALALQANPHLTWRDVQHLIVWTSEYVQLFRADNDLDYVINGAGLRYHPAFGFGALNAGALVAAALHWTTVPDKHICRVEATFAPEESISSRMPYHFRSGYTRMDTVKYKIPIDVKGCIVNYIEHVQLSVTIEHPRRGAINLILESPQGTIAEVLRARPNDNARTGFNNWNLTSVATWGENSNGVWKVRVKDADSNHRSVSHVGIIWRMSLVIHGTKVMPAHMKNGRRSYKYQFHNYHYQEEKEENDHGANNVAEVDSPTEENEHGTNNIAEVDSPTEENDHGANNVAEVDSPTEENEHGANNIAEVDSPTEENEHGANNVAEVDSPTEENEHGTTNNLPEENILTEDYYDDELYEFSKERWGK